MNSMTFDSEYEPFFQPPGWVVAPIWAVLYTCMAVSISTVLNQSEQLKHSKWILFLFIAQLLLNLAWPSVFNSERYLLSFGMLVFMILFTVMYAYLTYATVPTASMLVWPYIAWMTFAAAINAAYCLEAYRSG
ncbi:tryptophan-rich sensory protein [Euryarchaeota archaeon]|nr:tryptophan-rich sensory protein [Euryarchaeota archaeon]MDC3236206.1 tryptophan-rich sensory protein [Candidatus Poseidoniaceae archaeon]